MLLMQLISNLTTLIPGGNLQRTSHESPSGTDYSLRPTLPCCGRGTVFPPTGKNLSLTAAYSAQQVSLAALGTVCWLSRLLQERDRVQGVSCSFFLSHSHVHIYTYALIIIYIYIYIHKMPFVFYFVFISDRKSQGQSVAKPETPCRISKLSS